MKSGSDDEKDKMSRETKKQDDVLDPKNAEVPKSPKSTTKAVSEPQIVTPLKSSSIAIAKPAMYVPEASMEVWKMAPAAKRKAPNIPIPERKISTITIPIPERKIPARKSVPSRYHNAPRVEIHQMEDTLSNMPGPSTAFAKKRPSVPPTESQKPEGQESESHRSSVKQDPPGSYYDPSYDPSSDLERKMPALPITSDPIKKSRQTTIPETISSTNFMYLPPLLATEQDHAVKQGGVKQGEEKGSTTVQTVDLCTTDDDKHSNVLKTKSNVLKTNANEKISKVNMNVKQRKHPRTTLDESTTSSSNASSDDSSDHDAKVTRTVSPTQKKAQMNPVIDLCSSSSAEEDGVNTTKVTNSFQSPTNPNRRYTCDTCKKQVEWDEVLLGCKICKRIVCRSCEGKMMNPFECDGCDSKVCDDCAPRCSECGYNACRNCFDDFHQCDRTE
jgi:hypothetical protein